MSEGLLTKHADKLDWNLVSYNKNLSEEFIIKHSDKILNNYFINFEKVLKKIDLCENKGQNIQKFIKSNISERDFYRYN